MSQLEPVYVLEASCAERILKLIEGLHEAIEGMLQRRIVEAPDDLDDPEVLDLTGLVANAQARLEKDLF